jgi:Tol biopolymer transport system component
MTRVLVLAVALAGVAGPLGGQSYFGQNQVQYDQFDWQVLETEHFQIFYYPSEERAATDAGRMAERTYARLALVLEHQFREKKPIMLFSSRTDFAQNNVTGDLGEATGGVTEALHHRMLLNFTGDYRSFEHVLAHEMVHVFQYDIFARGKAGNGMQALAEFLPPLWFAEGMAEYLSLGPSYPLTDSWMRDAALNGHIPTVKQMTEQPDDYFPYRYGHSFWTYVGKKWGDEAIGQIMSAVPSVGVDRAFKRELGESLEDLGDQWREDLQNRLLPVVGSLDRARKFSQPLLTPRVTDGVIFLAPALSSDGSRIAFLSNGSLVRGQVFIDLWLADAHTGKRIMRLAASATNSDFEELRLLYSQSAFSPDGQRIAFTGQRSGKDVLYIMRIDGKTIERRFDLPIESVISPSWSPDGRSLVFSGANGGITNLYRIDADGTHFSQLTDDRFGDLQPQLSPDGTRIAFATDRGAGASFDLLRFPKWQIALYDIPTGKITLLPGQHGLNLNPQWAPDGRSIAYISDRTGIANVFLYDLDARQHYQLTNVVGGISGITEYSPAISWARDADRLAFTYFENGQYTVWATNNPRGLKRSPVIEPAAPQLLAAPSAPRDPALAAASASFIYRTSAGEIRESGNLPLSGDSLAPSLSIAVLLDSAELALPDTLRFRRHAYHASLQPDFSARPSIGYIPDNSGLNRSFFGGTTVVMSDLLGNHHLAASGELNGRLAESRLFLGYTNLAHRWQYSGGFSQTPYYFLTSDSLSSTIDPTVSLETQEIRIYVARQAFAVTAYPLNRFTRIEIGGGFNNVDRSRWIVTRDITGSTTAGPFTVSSKSSDPTLNYFDGQVALVSDNTIFGYTSPLMGRRFRLQVSPVTGGLKWVQGLLDYRRYDPIVFSYLTFASRIYADMSVGPEEDAFPKYIARPDFVRGYDRSNSFNPCVGVASNPSSCNALQLLGSRVAVTNFELRFPLLRRIELGVLPVGLPPIDGLFFFDAGVAWSKDQTVYGSQPVNFNVASQRYPLRSYGAGLRLNLFNYAILRWDYAIPIDTPGHRRFWTWSLWPSF